MPQISDRGKSMPASPIRKLVPYSEQAKRDGKKVYHLNIGQPDIPTPEVALEAIRNFDEKVIAYSHSAGNESYRKKLAGYYKSVGIDVDYTDLLITTGGSEALTFAFNSVMNPGDELIIPQPFYANYNAFANIVGVKIKPINATIKDGFALPPIEEFEKAITPKTKAILICNPNNPTGYLYSQEEIEQLGELAKKHDLYIFSDEVYREFCYDGHDHFSVMNLKGLEDNTILVDSVSKRYSACGVRIGAFVTKNKEVLATALKFAQSRLSPPSLGQVIGEASIDTPKEYFEEVYNEYIERRNYMVEALNKMEGVTCPMPKGAFYTITELPVDDTDKFCQWMLSDFSHKNQTVMMAPGSGFYEDAELGKQHVRIAYVLNKEDLTNAMEALEEGLKQYPGRTI
ncbi:pyridoxal phosphate-dependent aminotransferase [Salinivirga cyanobacteriivorans]|uniref:Aspartate aminotransferase n=1 Tax=Salinivirga cyanobacteriivorans TaxID=1307839 RepID=A0A0S2HYB1_9BACT|nr:pyridoxal phosphate-dependent aminotransferase [Salinivirga cyanobacteriivorans]ALO15113.1 Aspartate aminotransferase [Salinivirga cyanobacteriivorans]